MTEKDQTLPRDFSDFFENTLCGHAILDEEGRFVVCNGPLGSWLGCPSQSLRGRYFSEYLSVGARIFHETHLAPMLKMQGHYSEVSLELVSQDGSRLPVMVNAMRSREGDNNEVLFTRLTILLAVERQAYETNLRAARDLAESKLLNEQETAALREQFIAVLGHDLRNPLGAITMGAALLGESGLGDRQQVLVSVIESSAKRMNELVENLMDFARFRLGGGVLLSRREADLDKIFAEVIAELQTRYPDRRIVGRLEVGQPIDCDPARLSQILSNLLANALTHGAAGQPVEVSCERSDNSLVLTVRNEGEMIPPEVVESLFRPFTREDARSSQNGLGLGLYIASEVAKAHGGSLSVTSTEDDTVFKFSMPLSAVC